MFILIVAFVLGLPLAAEAQTTNPIVTFDTVLGSFEAELCAEESLLCQGAAPDTVANFLANIDDGVYEDSLVHLATPNSADQNRIVGGYFQVSGNDLVANAGLNDVIDNEFGQSNVRGTLAMDKPGGVGFDSHATRWFVNRADNSTLLDQAQGGFTVFGIVPDMTVVDLIAAQQICDIRLGTGVPSPSAFWSDTPLIGFSGTCDPPGGAAGSSGVPDVPEDFVVVHAITVPEPGAAAATGVVLAALGTLARARARA